MAQTDDWYRRVYFPAGAKASLGFGYECWLLEPGRYEGHNELKVRAATLKRRWGRRQLAYELVEHLLTDVIAAAGGVEHSVLALRHAVAEAQEWSNQHVKTTDSSSPHGIAHPSVVGAWYEFANVLSWARAVEERLDRRPMSSKGRAKLPRQGLVHAIKPRRLKHRVDSLLTKLRSGPMGETRFLANFTLHSALVRGLNSGARLGPNREVILPIPDTPVAPLNQWKLLTWHDERDGIAFAEELWASIEDFMEGLVEAYEKAVPKRLRKAT